MVVAQISCNLRCGNHIRNHTVFWIVSMHSKALEIFVVIWIRIWVKSEIVCYWDMLLRAFSLEIGFGRETFYHLTSRCQGLFPPLSQSLGDNENNDISLHSAESRVYDDYVLSEHEKAGNSLPNFLGFHIIWFEVTMLCWHPKSTHFICL